MSVEEALVALLEAAVGHERVYRRKLPETAALPALTYLRVGTVHGYTHQGDDGLPTARFQIDLYAPDDDANDVQATGILSLSGYSDDQLQRITIEDDRDLSALEIDIARRSIDLMVAHVPTAGS